MAKRRRKKKLSKAEAGRKGGKMTLKRHGRRHFIAIGKRGFTATCDKHYGGDRRAMLNALIRQGLAALDPCPWNGAWQNFTAFPDPAQEPEDLDEEEDPVVAQILASIRSARAPDGGGL